MSNIEKSIFALISFILSAVIVISILSKFSFLLPIQVAVFLVLLFLTVILFNKYSIKKNAYIVFSAILVIACVISYIYADFKINVRDYIFILVTSLFAGFNFSFLPMDFKKKVFLVPVFIALWLSMILFTRFISSPHSFFIGDNFYDSMALNINVIAGFLVLVYPLFFIFIKDNKNVNVFIAMTIFVLFAIFLTKSRIGIFLSFAVTIIFLLLHRKKSRCIKFLVIAGIILLILAIFYTSFLKINFNSISDRIIWWKTAYLMFKKNIFFGCGLGNYTVLFKTFRPELVLNTLYAHNIILELLAEIGIFGILSFIALVGSFYIKIINKIAEKKDVSFYIPVFFSVTTFLIMNLFDYSFFVPANMLMFFVVVSSVFNLDLNKSQNNKINTIVLISLYSIFAIFVAKPVIGQIHYKKGIEFYVANQYKIAIEEFEKAIKFDKNNPEYYAQVSRAYFALYDKMREVGQIYADKAIEYNKKAIDLYKNSGDLRASLASIYWNKGQKELALKTMQEAIKYDRFNPYFEENLYKMKNY